MRDYLAIVFAERRSLLRGLLISFVLVYPFTFVPTISKHGWNWHLIALEVPKLAAYTFEFCLMVVFAAIVHNYNNLVTRKNLFDFPAFTKLDFYGRIDGMKSITRELETFLIGEVGGYYYRLNLIDVDKEKHKLEIVPLIDLSNDRSLKNRLRKELGFRESWFFGLTIPISKIALQDELFILDKLKKLSVQLAGHGAIPVLVDEKQLQN